jgi:hypothetical protein
VREVLGLCSGFNRHGVFLRSLIERLVDATDIQVRICILRALPTSESSLVADVVVIQHRCSSLPPGALN